MGAPHDFLSETFARVSGVCHRFDNSIEMKRGKFLTLEVD